MKTLLMATVTMITISANAQNIQQQSQCPSGTQFDVYTAIAKDLQGNVISTDFQSYCRPIQQQQLSNCPEGTKASVYTVVETDQSGTVRSTNFQSYCKPLQHQQ